MSAIPDRDSGRVSLQLRLTIPEQCPLGDVEGEIVSASRQIVDDGCHSIFVVQPADGRVESVDWRHETDGHRERCICHAFCDEGVIPIFDHVADGRVTVSAFLEEESTARSLYESLKAVVSEVEVSKLNTSGDPSHANSLRKVDLTELTTKQLEALEAAVRKGYYEEPKAVTVTELAEGLGISRQAYSHRLKAAEARIFYQVMSDS